MHLVQSPEKTLIAGRAASHAEAPRLDPLASLPVFHKLAGRPVLLAGGSEAARWKAELLAAAGATVLIHAEHLSDDMAALAESGTVNGKVTHVQRPWSVGDFAGMALAIADAETDGEARAFHCAAQAAGIPVNVIDKPEFCTFQFGSIVNRSPAIVAISTDGAAPILGQAIRRRIETLLPKALSNWAALAKSVRASVNQRLEPGPQRRAFWELFSELALSGRNPPDEADALQPSLVHKASGAGKGKVTLVGAGPGDAELLTLKAVRALQSADVILHDDLVSDDVLELARREAKRMLVGKRGGRESCRQDDINDMMVSLAKAGRHVVRLKGGDPMIFGRAGEEIARLDAEGIPVSIVPGITSALAMAAELGLSLTHRDHARSVRFVTGHSRDGSLPGDLDWATLADQSVTTVYYMGGRTVAEIVARLRANGMQPGTPCVIASGIARPGGKTWQGDLAALGEAVAAIGLDQPLLIGVGSAFGARAVLPVSGSELPLAV